MEETSIHPNRTGLGRGRGGKAPGDAKDLHKEEVGEEDQNGELF